MSADDPFAYDGWCRAEDCRYRYWRSGPMPTHRVGDDCPAQPASLPLLATVQPDRDTILDALNRSGAVCGDCAREPGDPLDECEDCARCLNCYADDLLAADPRRTVAEVKAEALREAAEVALLDRWSGWKWVAEAVAAWLRARAARIEGGTPNE